MDEIKQCIHDNILHLIKRDCSFRISSKNLLKIMPQDSMTLNKELGSFVQKNTGANVDLKNFDMDIGVEVLDEAYIFYETTRCKGGLPVGVEGTVCCRLDNMNDALAALLMLKRGCGIFSSSEEPFGKEALCSFIPEGSFISGKDAHDTDFIVVGHTLSDYSCMDRKNILRPLIVFSERDIACLAGMLEVSS